MNALTLSLVVLVSGIVLMGCQDNDNILKISPSPAVVTPDSAHGAQNSLDWNGIYKGLVPCEDCSGTELFVELKADHTYLLSRNHLEKVSMTVMEEGTITWKDNVVTIEDMHFLVGENTLVLLDSNSKPRLNEEGVAYTLKKESL